MVLEVALGLSKYDEKSCSKFKVVEERGSTFLLQSKIIDPQAEGQRTITVPRRP